MIWPPETGGKPAAWAKNAKPAYPLFMAPGRL
jgi:hypothetical protein